jgi:hypothetical protein
VGEVVARRVRWPSCAVLGVCLLVLGGAVLVWLEPAGGYRPYRILLLAIFIVWGPVLWAVRRMRQPHLLRLVRDRLEMTSVLGGKRVLPLSRVQDDKGVVVDLETRTRIVVGARRYDGAEVFHRALRVRLALRRG